MSFNQWQWVTKSEFPSRPPSLSGTVKRNKTRYGISPQFWMLLGNRADFILTNVLGSIPSRELCPFKAGNQPGQPNICANDAGTAKKLVSNPLWDCLLLLLQCLLQSDWRSGHDTREAPVINVLEKVNINSHPSAPKKSPKLFFSAGEGRWLGSGHGLHGLLISLAPSDYKRKIAKLPVAVH